MPNGSRNLSLATCQRVLATIVKGGASPRQLRQEDGAVSNTQNVRLGRHFAIISVMTGHRRPGSMQTERRNCEIGRSCRYYPTELKPRHSAWR